MAQSEDSSCLSEARMFGPHPPLLLCHAFDLFYGLERGVCFSIYSCFFCSSAFGGGSQGGEWEREERCSQNWLLFPVFMWLALLSKEIENILTPSVEPEMMEELTQAGRTSLPMREHYRPWEKRWSEPHTTLQLPRWGRFSPQLYTPVCSFLPTGLSPRPWINFSVQVARAGQTC